MESSGFQRLPEVQTIRPRLPDEDGKDADLGGVFDVETSEMSAAFRDLMQRLAHQHLVELNRCKAASSRGFMDSDKSIGTGDNGSAKDNMSPKSHGGDSREGEPNRRRRRISALMGDKKGQKLSASRIMKTFDDTSPMMEESSTEPEPTSEKTTVFRRLQDWLQSFGYEMCVAGLLALYVLWLGFELQVYGVRSGKQLGLFADTMLPESSFWYWDQTVFPIVDLTFTAIFSVDVIVRVVILRTMFWKVAMNYIDVAVTCASFVEVIFYWAFTTPMAVNPMLFRLLRIGKLARAIRMVAMNSVLQSLQILTRCLVSSTNMLFWTFLLLTFFQCVAGLVASTLCRDFIDDESLHLTVREDVFRYYGTFTRTFLSMFEILFANWSPPCRVLVDNISEWFTLFFLVYRCILGFAVLNVVNAVFVQQTMKIATSDEQLAFKQKERELASYTRKVKNLFATMDQSGDGVINFEEFSKLVKSPMLQFLLSQLDLEYHDLLSLFEFLDNGDGEITLTEFIDGAAKLRGNAKALDIWRMETKIEVLFVEVLQALRGTVDVQEAMQEHGFRHVTFSTTNGRRPEDTGTDSRRSEALRMPSK